MYTNGKYDQAASIAEGIRLGKEIVADERLHTVVALKRYDATETREALYGVHAYGDMDENGNVAWNTVGLMNADYLHGFTDAVHLGAKWGYWHAESEQIPDDTKHYVNMNICPIEWHAKEGWTKRVVFYTRNGGVPGKPNIDAWTAKYGVKP